MATRVYSDTERAGQVLDVKRFAIHDGPGIRTTVFLKGCPLACSWCHNPESQRESPEILFLAARCTGCGACAAVCPAGAVRVVEGRAVTDRNACRGCGRCVGACLQSARSLVGERRTVAQVLALVERDLLFYDQSGGGLTLSGGEPLGQPDFTLAALREAKGARIPTAVDTCGHAAPEIIEEASRCADLFLYDLKLMDERRHAEATGLGNRLILDNVRRLGSLGARVWIRFPLIPGVNSDEEDVAAIGRFVRGLRGVEAIQVLPYHGAGEVKRDRLERPRDCRRFDVPAAEILDRTAVVLRREARRPVTIGG